MSRIARDSFSSKFGVIAAAAGSAIGLGNIWKFPYITGVHGGAAFLFVYLGFILAIGLPIMLSELVIGRKSRRNSFGSFKKLVPKGLWKYVGVLGLGAAFFILSFYGVVAGWSVRYIFFAFTDAFKGSSAEITDFFNAFKTHPEKPLLYQLIFMLATGSVVVLGVNKGIEKVSKVLMPVLLILILILDVRAITLDGASEGLSFLFKPDFSKLSFEAILEALGHAFFSLSLGMGTLITYGSYINKKNDLVKTAIQVTVADTVVALLAGIAIIPAVFAFGLEPSAGPGLIFETLPNVFQTMAGGTFFSILFFLLLSIAALTSAISILEVVVAYFTEELKVKRKVATILATLLTTLLGVICSLSLGIYSDVTIFGKNFFELLEFISSNILLPLGGMLIALFIGWGLGKYKVFKEIAQGGKLDGRFLAIFMFLVKFLAPIAIFIVFLYGLGVFK